jgi:hypothetical protein
MMWVPLDGFKMQTAGAVYVTHAVTRLQGSSQWDEPLNYVLQRFNKS